MSALAKDPWGTTLESHPLAAISSKPQDIMITKWLQRQSARRESENKHLGREEGSWLGRLRRCEGSDIRWTAASVAVILCYWCFLSPPSFIFMVCLLHLWLIRQQDANTVCKAAGLIPSPFSILLCAFFFFFLNIYFSFVLFCFLFMSSSLPGSLHS